MQSDKKKIAAQTHRSFDSMSGILGWILGLVKQEFPDFSLEGKRALEIGTGQFMNHPFGLYICGCPEVVTVDKDRLCDDPGASMQNIVHARRFLSPFVSHDDFVRRLKLIQATGYDLDQLAAIGINACLISEDHDFYNKDIIFSYATLEHIDPNYINAWEFMGVPNAEYVIHFVDLEDHRDPKNNPFAFLSEPTWETENRLRFSEWKKLFARYDMDIRYPYIAVRHDAGLPKKIDKSIKYTDEEDLRTTAFLMVGRR